MEMMTVVVLARVAFMLRISVFLLLFSRRACRRLDATFAPLLFIISNGQLLPSMDFSRLDRNS